MCGFFWVVQTRDYVRNRRQSRESQTTSEAPEETLQTTTPAVAETAVIEGVRGWTRDWNVNASEFTWAPDVDADCKTAIVIGFLFSVSD